MYLMPRDCGQTLLLVQFGIFTNNLYSCGMQPRERERPWILDSKSEFSSLISNINLGKFLILSVLLFPQLLSGINSTQLIGPLWGVI